MSCPEDTATLRVLSGACDASAARTAREVERTTRAPALPHEPEAHELSIENVRPYIDALPKPRDYAEYQERACEAQGFGLRSIYRDPPLGDER